MASSPWAAAFEGLAPLLYIASLALLITILGHAQAVLVPIFLAVMLAFILTPFVTALEHYRFPRLAAVAVVVLLTLSIIGAFGYVLHRQFSDLAVQLPHYSASIREKFAALRATRQGAIANIQKTVEDVSRELDKREQQQQARGKAAGDAIDVKKDVQPVLVVPAEPTDVERLRGMLEPVFEPLATAGIVLIMVIFMLTQREDLRNRFLRLVGHGRLTLTTKMIDEAGQRISRFLLTQLLINSAFGAVVATGLFFIGVPYAVLWGVAAALLRFVPFIGAALAMLLPTALAFVLFEGWWHTIATLTLFLSLDIITANAVEPLLVGHSIGVSSLSVLVMALFWAWLWGPIGLLLATPITVCLVVLGKYNPRLEFLSVLLSDAPALEPEVSYYQRLLAKDEDEASAIVEHALQQHSPMEVFDEVLAPAIILSARDRARDEIDEAEQQFVLQETRNAVQRLVEVQQEAKLEDTSAGNGERSATPKAHARILALPARSEGAELALHMLCNALDPATYEIHRLSVATLAAEVVTLAETEQPDLICITALPPGGLAHARYICKRLHARHPAWRILVVRPGLREDMEFDTEATLQRLHEAGANAVAMSVTEACTCIAQMLFPVLINTPEPNGLPVVRLVEEGAA